jgi:hypothetical protein
MMEKPRKPTPTGAYRTHTPPIVFVEEIPEPFITFDDDTPAHTSPTLVMYQQIHRIFDSFTPAQRQQFVAIAESFTRLSLDEQKFVTAAIEKLAGL